jgi:hypothetical protein
MGKTALPTHCRPAVVSDRMRVPGMFGSDVTLSYRTQPDGVVVPAMCEHQPDSPLTLYTLQGPRGHAHSKARNTLAPGLSRAAAHRCNPVNPHVAGPRPRGPADDTAT